MEGSLLKQTLQLSTTNRRPKIIWTCRYFPMKTMSKCSRSPNWSLKKTSCSCSPSSRSSSKLHRRSWLRRSWLSPRRSRWRCYSRCWWLQTSCRLRRCCCLRLSCCCLIPWGAVNVECGERSKRPGFLWEHNRPALISGGFRPAFISGGFSRRGEIHAWAS